MFGAQRLLSAFLSHNIIRLAHRQFLPIWFYHVPIVVDMILGLTWDLLGSFLGHVTRFLFFAFFSRKISNGSFDLTKLRTITRTHPECNSKIKGFVCLFVPLRLLPLRYFRSIIQKKMCFSFGFCSLIRTFNPSDFRYFRSEKLK